MEKNDTRPFAAKIRRGFRRVVTETELEIEASRGDD
jgi:hypothetical protein